jgi:hypothetical protein
MKLQIFYRCFEFNLDGKPADLWYTLDLSTSMTYVPGTGPQPVFPQARLEVCSSGSSCSAARLETILTLHTDHVGVGCDRDTYSIASQGSGGSTHSQLVILS